MPAPEQPFGKVSRHHPQTTPVETVDRILELALDHPDWGCVRVAEELKRQAPAVSSPTVQKILIEHGLGAKVERCARLEQAHLVDGRPLTEEQALLIEHANPRFRERQTLPARPGELLVQGDFVAGTFAGMGKIHVHLAVDLCTAFSFAFVFPGTSPASHVSLLHGDVLPYFAQRRLKVGGVITEIGWDYDGHPYPQYLQIRGIQRQTSAGRGVRMHGFLEDFHRALGSEFLPPCFGDRPPLDRAALQGELDGWLYRRNHEVPMQGFPTRGRPPAERVDAYLRAAWDAVPS